MESKYFPGKMSNLGNKYKEDVLHVIVLNLM